MTKYKNKPRPFRKQVRIGLRHLALNSLDRMKIMDLKMYIIYLRLIELKLVSLNAPCKVIAKAQLLLFLHIAKYQDFIMWREPKQEPCFRSNLNISYFENRPNDCESLFRTKACDLRRLYVC